MKFFSLPSLFSQSLRFCRWIFLFAGLQIPLAQGAPTDIAALGFIEPEDGILNINGAGSVQGNTVQLLYVDEGDTVKSGEVIAILNSHDRLGAALNRAKAQLNIRKVRLEQLLAGPRPGLVDAQKAKIAQIRAQISIAKKRCERFRTLRANGKIGEVVTVSAL